MDKRFDSKSQESDIYQQWIDNGLLKSSPNNQNSYLCFNPPPNITGVLHIGHALNSTIQDILIRYHKLQGYNTLYIPGTDHAGISLQHVVERELSKNKITRHQLGRDEFLKKCHEWKDTKQNSILSQFKRLGCSFDWAKEQFTLNEHFSRLVVQTFVKLYHDGLIYRGKYIINWCSRCATALSDDEVEHKSQNGKMYYLRYKFTHDTNKSLIIATTRPETIFGDVAIAFHPSDERYKEYQNQEIYVPIINRKIKLISDPVVHKDFGTGLVKITPAHDRNDYQVGKTHHLQFLQIIDERCRIKNTGTKYDGLDRFKCREEIVKELFELQLIEKIENYCNNIGQCYRCQTIIEPYLSDQWFIRMEPLIKLAQDAINTKQIVLLPEYQTKIFNVWTSQNMDWCISRQLWWGHRIPIWNCQLCKQVICQESIPNQCDHCQSTNLQQDPDVLDTWFSSSLWSHGIFTDISDFNYYYPADILVTGKDILYFWVSRMMMMSIYLTGKIPFKKVLLHGVIRDKHGEKMSKTKGNVIDPIEIIDKYGADALRYTLMYNLSLGEDLTISLNDFKIGQTFCTKLWNSVRYILMNLNDQEMQTIDSNITTYNDFDNWILDKLNKVKINYNKHLNEFVFSNALKELTDFFWNDFCNMYLEITKTMIDDINTKKILLHIICQVLKLYHPYTPFVTEALWSHIPLTFRNCQSILQSTIPSSDIVNVFDLPHTQYFIETIYKIREQKLTEITCSENYFDSVVKYKNIILKLTKLNDIKIIKI